MSSASRRYPNLASAYEHSKLHYYYYYTLKLDRDSLRHQVILSKELSETNHLPSIGFHCVMPLLHVTEHGTVAKGMHRRYAHLFPGNSNNSQNLLLDLTLVDSQTSTPNLKNTNMSNKEAGISVRL